MRDRSAVSTIQPRGRLASSSPLRALRTTYSNRTIPQPTRARLSAALCRIRIALQPPHSGHSAMQSAAVPQLWGTNIVRPQAAPRARAARSPRQRRHREVTARLNPQDHQRSIKEPLAVGAMRDSGAVSTIQPRGRLASSSPLRALRTTYSNRTIPQPTRARLSAALCRIRIALQPPHSGHSAMQSAAVPQLWGTNIVRPQAAPRARAARSPRQRRHPEVTARLNLQDHQRTIKEPHQS